MKEDILRAIIEVEKEIRERIEDEKKKAREEVERFKKEQEREMELEERRLNELIDKAIDDARVDAEREAKRIVDNELMNARRLESFSDDELKAIIARHIRMILP